MSNEYDPIPAMTAYENHPPYCTGLVRLSPAAHLPESVRPPVYHDWLTVPPGLFTKNQLKILQRRVLKPNAEPAAYCKTRLTHYPLYTIDQTVAMTHSRGPKDWPAVFAERYASRESALLTAAASLFELNRFTKHSSCTEGHRLRIYTLKMRFLQFLWDEGYCVSAVLAQEPTRDITCSRCFGSGEDEFAMLCDRCGGTGIYRIVEGKHYWSLRYQIGVREFGWHLPADLAPWAQECGEPSIDDRATVTREVKPVSLPRKRHPEACALITWVCDARSGEEMV